MGRQIRPDWEGALHHVMARGIDGRAVFNSSRDRSDLYQRLSQLVTDTGIRVYAWVIMPNHVHLLVRTGSKPISTFMHRLLTGYAVCYNRREDRKGHVFQGRFKSILVQEEEYFLQLVKYIHLNPLKAGIVDDYESLLHYNWSGHASLLGVKNTPWQDVDFVLSKFDIQDSKPMMKYLKFIKEDMSDKETQKLIWGNYALGRAGITVVSYDEAADKWNRCCKILGSREFALDVMKRLKGPGSWPCRERQNIHDAIEIVLDWATEKWGITLNSIRGNHRNPELTNARAAIAWICWKQLGLSKTECAKLLHTSRSGASKAIARGALLANDSTFFNELNLLSAASGVRPR
jgi:REP element-mobilizing transposase RayT